MSLKIKEYTNFHFTKKDGTIHDISNTALIIDYKQKKILPTVDKLLDWRNRIHTLKKEDTNNEYPEYWYDKEIMATDFLLLKHTKLLQQQVPTIAHFAKK